MNKVFYSYFKDHIQSYVELKQAIGHKFDATAGTLKRFDRFLLKKYPEATVLTKEIILEWCSKKTHEAQANQYHRACTIRQFGKHLDSLGHKAYIVPEGYYPVPKQYSPHIYTMDELDRFFKAIDTCQFCYRLPYQRQIMPVIFRMFYMCGLRLSEARFLKTTDVNLETGVLTINHSKHDNSRLVPMSDSLTERCRSFSQSIHSEVAKDYYFPGFNNKPLTIASIYSNFRKFLWHAGISHHGKMGGPRIHDFRHTYAVHCLKKWVEQGKNLTTCLPMLKTYMGHKSFQGTAYYLRMTADVFPDITMKIEALYPEIIPKLQGEIDETY